MNTHDESQDHEESQESQKPHEHHEHHHSGHEADHATHAESAKPDVTRETVTDWTVPKPDAPSSGTASN